MRKYLFFNAEIIIYVVHNFLRFLKSFLFLRGSEKVGIIVFKKLGDTVFVIPAIKHLIEIYKKENIVVFCYDLSLPILKEKLDINLVPINEDEFWLKGRIASFKVRKKIAWFRFKKIYDLTCQVRSASAILGMKSETYGHNDYYCSGVYDNFVNPLHLRSLIDRFLYIADPFNNKIPFDWEKEFHVVVQNEKPILIHPFAGWKAKEWNLKKFITLYELLSKDHSVSIIFHPDDMPHEIRNYLISEKINFVETNTIDDLVNEIKNCSILIGNDSGPIYIARILGKPTFTIYGPTNSDFTMVQSIFHSKIIKNISCSPLYDSQYCFTFAGRKGCPSFECMHQLTVDEVYDEVIRYLELIQFYINKKTAVI